MSSINIKKQLLKIADTTRTIYRDLPFVDITKDNVSFKKINGIIKLSPSGVISASLKQEDIKKSISENYTFEDFIGWYVSIYRCIRYPIEKNSYEIPILHEFSEIKQYLFDLEIEPFGFKQGCVLFRGKSSFMFFDMGDNIRVIHSWQDKNICNGINPEGRNHELDC